MRTEKEVIDQLLSFAREQESVRAVVWNGSRVNPNAPHDIFCDYDIAFVVTDPDRFLTDQSWIARFGSLIILQQNDWTEDGIGSYIFLMLFSDGVRIDLAFDPIDYVKKIPEDSLTVILLDKDQLFQPLPPPNETAYITSKPGPKEFAKAVNNFWWCSTNVAKGIWRDEFCYARYMYEAIVKEEFMKMVAWYIAANHNWQVNSGLYGKWFKKYLPEELWTSFEKTYPGSTYPELWDAMYEAGRLMHQLGPQVAANLGYDYPLADDLRVTAYLDKVRHLPEDSQSF